LGFGPFSPLWDPIRGDQNFTGFSIEMARPSNDTQDGQTNLTLGSLLIPQEYDTQPFLTLASDVYTTTFEYGQFLFGEVYYDSDQKPSSEYFEDISCSLTDLSCNNTVQISTVSQGLQLPAAQYSQFQTYLKKAIPEADCDTGVGGFCVINQPCSQLHTTLLQFSFKLTQDP
jgi:hypothetical protein